MKIDVNNLSLQIKCFSDLTIDDLYKILQVRAAVFVVEQNCVYQDLDDIDKKSIHVFYECEGKILAYLRVFYKDKEQRIVKMGRVLTVERGIGLGKKLLDAGIIASRELMNADKLYIEAQTYAIGFYEKVGFEVVSDEFLEDGIPHVQMILGLNKK